MSRRALVLLAVVAASTAAAALVVAFGGYGSRPESPQHKAVAAYIKDVDRIQGRLSLQLARISGAYQAFANAKSNEADVARQLGQVERTLKTLHRRLDALPAPPPARKLRRLLIALAAAEAGIAGEVHELAVFIPRFKAALSASHAASVRLSHDLAGVKPPTAHVVRGTATQVARAKAQYTAAAAAAAAAQAAAVDAYDTAIAGVIRRLRVLRPPPAMTPAYRGQLRSLVATRAAGAALADELRKTDRSRVPQLNRRFALATRLAADTRVQKAEIAAVKAYNARVKDTRTLAVEIQGELRRVQLSAG